MNNSNYDLARQRAMNAPIPLRTESYSPIPHSDFLETIQRRINEGGTGLNVTGERLYTNLSGEKLVGITTINFKGSDPDPVTGIEMMLGYKNSYDKSMAAALAAGGSVMVCGNGIVTGDLISFRRKHTGTAREELADNVDIAITRMREGFADILMDVDIMRGYQITERQKAEILGVMYFEEDLISPTQLSVVKKEMHESPNFRGDSIWDLYNNVTESLKRSHPIRLIEDHINLHNFMSNIVGIDRNSTEEVEPLEVPMEDEG